ncbi:RICIN domain-containing protein [Pseudoduganella armeniaca]|uniref:Uncharacterized protein n=1 Tax=Pseudoduganella armeniaca TaxID=2072590 RepID=A0A2R4CCK0_9BURK|nr:RICIN domain-containing protein [Pseudoduganella armeniaca]AVR97363.1 hypothetical protein C9I28_18230 [Pseudoduganella armeniaca]
MAQLKQTYLIILVSDSRFCLGVRDVAHAVPLELRPYDEHDATVRWVFGADGLIRPAADAGLCVEARGVCGSAGLACLGTVMPGKLAQHWCRDDGAIVNQLYPKLVLDHAGGHVAPGNPVRVRALPAAAARQWRLHALGPADGH